MKTPRTFALALSAMTGTGCSASQPSETDNLGSGGRAAERAGCGTIQRILVLGSIAFAILAGGCSSHPEDNGDLQTGGTAPSSAGGSSSGGSHAAGTSAGGSQNPSGGTGGAATTSGAGGTEITQGGRVSAGGTSGTTATGGAQSAGGVAPTGGALGSGGTGAKGGTAGNPDGGATAGSGVTGGNGGGGATVPDRAVNFKGFNWADQRDNFVDGVLYVSGLSSSSTYEQAQTLAAMVVQTWQGVGANTVRLSQ